MLMSDSTSQQGELESLLALIGSKSKHHIDIKVGPKPGRKGHMRVQFNGKETISSGSSTDILIYLKGVLHGMQLND
mgnify:FL=1|jgi:hypothetical protein